MYHLKSSHGYDVELSPGLEERFLRLKKQNRFIQGQKKLWKPTQCPSSESDHKGDNSLSNYPGYPQLSSHLLSPYSKQDVFPPSPGKVYYSCENNSFPVGKAELDESSGFFKCERKDLEPMQENVSLTTPNSDDVSLAKPGGNIIGKVLMRESNEGTNYIKVKSETVLVTRVDGVSQNGDEVSMYKCYLCGKLYNHLSQLRHHLIFHFDRQVTTYHCDLCNSSFWFKYQIIQHLRKKHPVEIREAISNISATSLTNQKAGTIEIDQSQSGVPDPHGLNSGMPETNQSDSGIVVDEIQSNLSSENSENLNGDMQQTEKESELSPVDISYSQFYHELSFTKNNKGKFVCMICKKAFNQEKKLLRHIKEHSNCDLFYCDVCNSGFPTSDVLHSHMKSTHGMSKMKNEGQESALDLTYRNNHNLLNKLEDGNGDTKGRLMPHSLIRNSDSPAIQPGNGVENLHPEYQKNIHFDTPAEKGKRKDRKGERNALDFLVKVGLAEDVTVVMPCDPEEEQDVPQNLSMCDSRREAKAEYQSEEVENPLDYHQSKVLDKSGMDVTGKPWDLSSHQNGACDGVRETLEEERMSVAAKPTNRITKSKRKSSQPTRIFLQPGYDGDKDSAGDDKLIIEPETLAVEADVKDEPKENKDEHSSSQADGNSLVESNGPEDLKTSSIKEESDAQASEPSTTSRLTISPRSSPNSAPAQPLPMMPPLLPAPSLMAQYLQHSAQAQAQLIASSQFVNTLASLSGQSHSIASLSQALANPAAQAMIATGQYSTLVQVLAKSGHIPASLAKNIVPTHTAESSSHLDKHLTDSQTTSTKLTSSLTSPLTSPLTSSLHLGLSALGHLPVSAHLPPSGHFPSVMSDTMALQAAAALHLQKKRSEQTNNNISPRSKIACQFGQGRLSRKLT